MAERWSRTSRSERPLGVFPRLGRASSGFAHNADYDFPDDLIATGARVFMR
jgi:hypothetical protein